MIHWTDNRESFTLLHLKMFLRVGPEPLVPSRALRRGLYNISRTLADQSQTSLLVGPVRYSMGVEAMEQHVDPRLLADVARILLDCGLRPEECFRLKPANVVEGKLEIHFGKTGNARRRIPMTPSVQAILDMRLTKAACGAWVFPAPTRSGHIEPSSLKKQHAKAISEATRTLRQESGDPKRRFAGFELYTLRHTCLTRWAPHMDPWTLAYLAGHRDMNITKRYVHPQQQTILDAMEKARVAKGGHNSGHNANLVERDGQADSAAIN